MRYLSRRRTAPSSRGEILGSTLLRVNAEPTVAGHAVILECAEDPLLRDRVGLVCDYVMARDLSEILVSIDGRLVRAQRWAPVKAEVARHWRLSS